MTSVPPASSGSSAGTGFSALPLSPAMLANLEQLGYRSMTAIQAAALPPALLGKDIIAQAKTGSGKTAAFALTLLANLNPRRFAVQALVLCPTRELADQVTTEVRRLARAEDNIKVVTLCGGVPLRGQLATLEHGAHIVVGTPGRIMDHLERGSLQLEALNTLVLDEADRMLDMGFFEDIATVARRCPKTRQTLLFSATYPQGIAKLSAQFMREPVTVKVEAQHAGGQIEQRWYEVTDNDRLDVVGRCWPTSARPVRWPSATPRPSAVTWWPCCRRRASAHWRCSVNWSSASATRCWCVLPTAAARCWWPPTWPPVAWTLPTWRR
jgi:ATP-dependent RNA helicase DbpA